MITRKMRGYRRLLLQALQVRNVNVIWARPDWNGENEAAAFWLNQLNGLGGVW